MHQVHNGGRRPVELLTLQEIAARLNMAPSTVRYYKNQYQEFMPGVKAGRFMKYEPEAIEIIKFIAAATAATKQQQDIKELLSAKFALNIEENEKGQSVAATAAAAATVQQQQTDITIYQNYVADLKSEIEFLREELCYKDTILLKTLQQLEQEQRPWYKRIFKRET
jgi:DNA-binding transcriptional MerR regulator